MKKLFLVVTSLLIPIIASSCANTESPPEYDNPIIPLTSTVSEDTLSSKLPTPKEEYITLVESYIEPATFQQMDENLTRELSDLLLGHYTITGRTAGEGMEYYFASRSEAAPVYKDYESINISYVSGPDTMGEVLRIGYYDKASKGTILYEIDGYQLLERPLDDDSLDYFVFCTNESFDGNVNPVFVHAFTQSGRDMLDFINKHSGLTLYRENSPYIEFSYQDEDTLKFYSSPYSCYISFKNHELEEIRSLLSSSSIETNIKSVQDAWNLLSSKDSTIRTTGAGLHIDGRHYVLVGNMNFSGYMLSYSDEHEFVSLEYNEAIFNVIMNKIQETMDIDYRNFDAHWFNLPLKSAIINFPERTSQADGSAITELRSQTINDRDKLSALSKLMDKAINSEEIYGFSGCPYIATIDFTREDDETMRIFIATDSCDSMAYEGRIGFEYGKQTDLAAIFDEAMALRLENPKDPISDNKNELDTNKQASDKEIETIAEEVKKDLDNNNIMDVAQLIKVDDGSQSFIRILFNGVQIAELKDPNLRLLSISAFEYLDLDGDDRNEIFVTAAPDVNSRPLTDLFCLKESDGQWKQMNLPLNEIGNNGFTYRITRGKDEFDFIISSDDMYKEIHFDASPYFEDDLSGHIGSIQAYRSNNYKEGDEVGFISAWGIWEASTGTYEGRNCIIARQGIEGPYGHGLGLINIYFAFISQGDVEILKIEHLP